MNDTGTPSSGRDAVLSEENKNKGENSLQSDGMGSAPVPPIGALNVEKVSAKVVHFIPEDIAKKYRMMAVRVDDGGVFDVAMENPQDIEALNALQFLAKKDGVEYRVFSSDTKTIRSLFSLYESTEKALEEAVQTLKGEEEAYIKKDAGKQDDLINVGAYQDAPVAKLVDVVIRRAIEKRASDIHIEPIDKEYRVRFRIDGSLRAALSLPLEVGRAMVARIKILSNLKIDEKRKPQDGRFRLEDDMRRIDFRISTLPVIEGEKVVMRVLDKDSGLGKLDALGLMGKNFEIFDRHIRDPYGIVLITGPTGSGKSTTLYAFLQILNEEVTNIITLEDPVEYFIGGINQSQIRPEIGYTFASGLRSILRQDPNVIMVGEIRDSETAELAIHAALTGHLVFSTLHTNDAVGSIPRLVDMGIENFLISASVRVVAAQRLVRRICEKCKEKIRYPDAVMEKVRAALSGIPPEEFKKYGVGTEEEFVFYKGKGCEACGQKGYKGRVAIYEVLEVTQHLQDIIAGTENTESVVVEEAKKQGMISIKQDGILKAILGLTTLSEVERVTEGSLSVGGDVSDDAG